MTKQEVKVQIALGTLPFWKRIELGEFEFVEEEHNHKTIGHYQVPVSIGIKVCSGAGISHTKIIANENCICIEKYFKFSNNEKRTRKNSREAIGRIAQRIKNNAELISRKIES